MENVLIRLRSDTAANWAASTTPIPDRQLVHESDTGQMKVGDGVSLYSALPYTATQGLPGLPGAPGLTDGNDIAAALDAAIGTGWRTVGGGPAVAYRYWRINISQTFDTVVSASEIEFRETIGGADATTAGVAISGGDFSSAYAPGFAFDDLTGSLWHGPPATLPAWVGWDFGAGNEKVIAEISWRSRDGFGEQSFRFATVEGSDDLVAWNLVRTLSEQNLWASGETRLFGV